MRTTRSILGGFKFFKGTGSPRDQSLGRIDLIVSESDNGISMIPRDSQEWAELKNQFEEGYVSS